MAELNGMVGPHQRRAVIGKRVSGGASSSPTVSPALGTTSEPAKSAATGAEPVREEPAAQKNMTSITDYSSSNSNAAAETRSDAIGDGLGGKALKGLNSMNEGPSLGSPPKGPSLNGASNPYSQVQVKREEPLPAPNPAYMQSPPPPGQQPYQQGYAPPQYQQPAYPQQEYGQSGYPQQGYQQVPPQYQQQAPPDQYSAYQQNPAPPNQYNAYQQAPPYQYYQQNPAPMPEMPPNTPEQAAYGGPAAQPMTRTERDAQLPPPNPVPQPAKPAPIKEEPVNPNPTIGSYLASKESDENDLYSMLNGLGKENKLEKRKTMKELASGLLGGKKKKPKEV